MSKDNYVVIMAGGAGTRFWPLSTSKKPKQFLDILNTGKTLLQDTYQRALKICDKENIIIVSNKEYKHLIQAQLPHLPSENIWLEPYRKNTAPCIAYAAYKLSVKNPNAVTLVLPSDHIIKKENVFVKAIQTCFKKAKTEDCLITIGIKPTRPDTGYGYIQHANKPIDKKNKKIFKVKTFTEKPNIELARQFIKSKEFLWNAGIFVWSVKSIIQAFEKYDNELAQLFSRGKDTYYTAKESSFIEKTYSVCKNNSIDYAILEKADNVYVLATSIGWSDIGTWRSLYENSHHDSSKNAIKGKNVMAYNTSKCLVNVPNDKLVVLMGIKDLIVVESNNMLLICNKNKEQEVKNIVNEIRIKKGDEFI